MSKERVVLVGDSLGMPRPSESIEYEDTYPFLLKQELSQYEIISKHKRANDTSIQNTWQNFHDEILWLKPNIVVIHLGIVDCAPRLFTKLESRLLSALPSKIQNIIIRFFSKNRFFFTKLRKITYVNRSTFKNNLETIIFKLRSNNISVILIDILDTNEKNQKKSFHFKENINHYNLIIYELVKKYKIELIEINTCENGLLEDGIHITKKMHLFIFNKIKKIIKK